MDLLKRGDDRNEEKPFKRFRGFCQNCQTRLCDVQYLPCHHQSRRCSVCILKNEKFQLTECHCDEKISAVGLIRFPDFQM